MQRHASCGRERSKEVAQVLARERAERLAREAEVDHSARPTGQVDHGARERLIQRRVGRAEADDAAPLAERLIKRLAEGKRAVLDRVVIVDLEVARHFRVRSKRACLASAPSMWSRKPMPVCDLCAAGAIERELDLDRRLRVLRLTAGGARSAHPVNRPAEHRRPLRLRARSGRAGDHDVSAAARLDLGNHARQVGARHRGLEREA